MIYKDAVSISERDSGPRQCERRKISPLVFAFLICSLALFPVKRILFGCEYAGNLNSRNMRNAHTDLSSLISKISLDAEIAFLIFQYASSISTFKFFEFVRPIVFLKAD